MTDVETIDVTALKVLAVATRSAARRAAHLVLRGCGPAVRRMLHLTHLIRLVEVERHRRSRLIGRRGRVGDPTWPSALPAGAIALPFAL